MAASYLVLECVPAADGGVRVTDLRGGAGGGLADLAAAAGGQGSARNRLRPCLEHLAELAQGKIVLFLNDPFAAALPFPDDYFNLVQRSGAYGPITDWVPDVQGLARRLNGKQRPELELLGPLFEPVAARLKLKLAYCTGARVDLHRGVPKLLLSGYRDRWRSRETTVILDPQQVGAVVYHGSADRFPADLAEQSWFPVVNRPLLDRVLANRWLPPMLVEGTRAAALLPRAIPVGMGLRTSAEIVEFAAGMRAPAGFPLAVLKPSQEYLGNGIRFLDRTALRAVAARQPEARIKLSQAESLVAPRVIHSYEEVSGYRGKVLDGLLRTPGAEVHDHGDGTFHYSAPYPFLQSSIAMLQEYVEPRPIKSRRTNKLHRGFTRAVVFQGKLLAAIHYLDHEPDDGGFRDLTRPDVRLFPEAAAADEESTLLKTLTPLVTELDRQLEARVRTPADLDALQRQWLTRHAAPG